MMFAQKIRVWDLPTRLFHWALVSCIAGAWITHEMGASGFEAHTWFGYTALTLALWRLGWGLAGTRHARFASFIRGPGKVTAYLRAAARGEAAKTTGHNPAAGWWVLLLLALVLSQGLTGLFNGGELLMEGPWFHTLDRDSAKLVEEAHELGFNLILALALLHLSALAFHRWRLGERLVAAMVTGRKSSGEPGEGIGGDRWPWALGLLALAAALVWALVYLAPPPPVDGDFF